MNDTETPRTNRAAYYMGRTGADKDNQRWCDLLNESRSIERELIEARAVLSEIVRLGEGMPEDSRETEIAKNFLENNQRCHGEAVDIRESKNKH